MYIHWSGFSRLAFLAVLAAAAGLSAAGQTATEKKAEIGWPPSRPAVNNADYAGRAACASCHPEQSKNQSSSEMAQSILRPAEAGVLASHPEMSFKRGKYTYSLHKKGRQVTFTATDGHDTITEPLFVAVGKGKVFQAYLIQHGGEYYRVPVAYYAADGMLGTDVEASPTMPATLEMALGKQLSADDVRGCFRCHSPASVIGDKIDTGALTPGIGCEVCHGPGAKHVAAVRAGKPQDATLFSPADLRPKMRRDFCDQCHESASNMKAEHPQGTRSVVSPAYRLEQSRCYHAADQRSSCSFCHEPHAPMEQKSAAYDSKCLACHAERGEAIARSDQPGKACPVGNKNCAGCHMPKVTVTNSPIPFTDHRIRIVAAGAPFPE